MQKMPVLFVGHGSPMNAIEDNEYSRSWADIRAIHFGYLKRLYASPPTGRLRNYQLQLRNNHV